MLYTQFYIPSFQAQAVPKSFIELYAEMSTVASCSLQQNKINVKNVNTM